MRIAVNLVLIGIMCFDFNGWLFPEIFSIDVHGIFVVLISIWIFLFTYAIYRKILLEVLYSKKICRKRFQRLSENAIATILEMYQSPSYSAELNINDATTIVLELELFIGRGYIGKNGIYFDYYLQPWVVEYLSKNPSEYTSTTKDNNLSYKDELSIEQDFEM